MKSTGVMPLATIFMFALTISGTYGRKLNCPILCKCRPTDLFDMNQSLLYDVNQSISIQHQTVTCPRKDLTEIPLNLPRAAIRLYLPHNKLTYLTNSSFATVPHLRVLVLANNRITRIENDTFHAHRQLEYLDLSNNFLKTLPDLLLCLWKPFVQAKELNEVQRVECPVRLGRARMLSLLLHGNRWHCTCYLQQLIQTYCCLRNIGPTCVKFVPVGSDAPAIGYCSTPTNIEAVPLNRLRSKEVPGFPRVQVVNLCVNRSVHVDVVLLVVMIAWIGITMGCVLHFVSWNNKEVERHKSYVSGLDRKPKVPSPPKPVRSSLVRSPKSAPRSRRPDIAINGNIIESTGNTPESIRSRIQQFGSTSTPSPVWKPRKTQKTAQTKLDNL